MAVPITNPTQLPETTEVTIPISETQKSLSQPIFFLANNPGIAKASKTTVAINATKEMIPTNVQPPASASAGAKMAPMPKRAKIAGIEMITPRMVR